jgi:hypothetical protein
MKSLFLTLLLALSVTTANAATNSISFEVEHQDFTTTDAPDVNALSIIPAHVFDNGVKIDLRLQGLQSNTTTATVIEPRVSYAIPVGPVQAGLRASIGQRLVDSGNYAFYTIEPFVAYDATKEVQLITSVRLTDALGSRDVQTETLYAGGSYKLDNTNALYTKVYHRFDSVNSNGIEAGYTITF